MKTCQSTSEHYEKILALISVWHISYLLMNVAINNLTSKILKQILTDQLSLKRHAFVWTEISQSFMNLAEEDEYYETHFFKIYIQRSDCWWLWKLSSTVNNDLHYEIDSITSWASSDYAVLKNCSLRNKKSLM